MTDQAILKFLQKREIYFNIFSSIILGDIALFIGCYGNKLTQKGNTISNKEWQPIINLEINKFPSDNRTLIKIKNDGHELKNFKSNLLTYCNIINAKNDTLISMKFDDCAFKEYPTNNSIGTLFTYETKNLVSDTEAKHRFSKLFKVSKLISISYQNIDDKLFERYFIIDDKLGFIETNADFVSSIKNRKYKKESCYIIDEEVVKILVKHSSNPEKVKKEIGKYLLIKKGRLVVYKGNE